jgi:hypothetical protein
MDGQEIAQGDGRKKFGAPQQRFILPQVLCAFAEPPLEARVLGFEPLDSPRQR